MLHERTKHIDLRYHFLHEFIACGDIVVKKIWTQNDLTYMMTKSLLITKFVHSSNLVGLGCEFCPLGLSCERRLWFDLVLRYRVCWFFSAYDGNSCQWRLLFYDSNFVLGFCSTQNLTVQPI